MSLSRDAILATVPVLNKEEVFIPEWQGSVFVRVLRCSEKDVLEAKNIENKNKHFRARFCAAVVCDEQGNKLFNEADILTLSQHPSSIFEPIIQAAMRLNHWTEKEMEELEKNSENGQLEDSG